MKLNEWLSKKWVRKTIAVVLLFTAAMLSIFVLGSLATNPATYAATIEAIDERKATVMGVTATAVTASTALAAVPGDVTTPIASQILEISEYLFLVVCILVLEKSMLTVMGYLAFKILIPIACGLLAAEVLVGREGLKNVALKIVVFALVIATIIPASMKISNFIYEMNSTEIEQMTMELDQISGGAAQEETADPQTESQQQEEAQEEKKGLVAGIKDLFSSGSESNETEQEQTGWWESIKKGITGAAADAKELAKEMLNSFIDAIALFVIVYCAVPIVVVLLMVWFVNTLFGMNLRLPKKSELYRPFKKEKRRGSFGSISNENSPGSSGAVWSYQADSLTMT